MTSEYLFSQYDLHGVSEAQKKRIIDEIEGIAADRLLNTTPESWVECFQSSSSSIRPSSMRRASLSIRAKLRLT